MKTIKSAKSIAFAGLLLATITLSPVAAHATSTSGNTAGGCYYAFYNSANGNQKTADTYGSPYCKTLAASIDALSYSTGPDPYVGQSGSTTAPSSGHAVSDNQGYGFGQLLAY